MTPVIARRLGLGGLVPFIGLTVIAAADVMGWAGPAEQALRVYAALILSFLGGISWGLALRNEHERLFILSMVPFFGAWSALLINGLASYLVLMGSYLAAYATDRFADRKGLFPSGFMSLRGQLTLVVMVCLAVSASSL